MKRLRDWEDRLTAYLAERQAMPFRWGTNDCALFACGAVEAMTGVDPGADFAGQYDDGPGARKALREIGAGTLLKTFRARFDEKPPAFAQRGDLVWNGRAVGVCVGGEALFVGEEDGRAGLVRVPRHEWTRAFAVPHG